MSPSKKSSSVPDFFGEPQAQRQETPAKRGGKNSKPHEPLADRLRPQSLDDVTGQNHLLGSDGLIGRMLSSGSLSSLILWGPPGCGKTTIARLLAKESGLAFAQLLAVGSGVSELRDIFASADMRAGNGVGTLLFIDEIHRFNRAQQDHLLNAMETGLVTLIGATTENPSFALTGALLSRAQVVEVHRLDEIALEQLVDRAEKMMARKLPLDEEARSSLISMSDGDGRYLLGLAEQLFAYSNADEIITPDMLAKVLQRRAPVHDRAGEAHYNLLSALHKTIRGSDVDASLYYFARLISGGEDPRVIARRLTRAASEDIGLADPQALTVALAGWESYERLGTPEGELALAQVVVYLATAPKSNALYTAMKAAQRAAKEFGVLPPPKTILNAPTKMMDELGYGDGYLYDHDQPDAFSGQNYFPEAMDRKKLYYPVERGFEREIAKRMSWWDDLRAKRNPNGKENK